MSSQPNGTSASPASPKKLKILMLHGYTQSGPLFHAKTRALEKALHKAFPPAPPSTAPISSTTTTSPKPKPLPPGTLPSPPGGIQLIYPSGPRKLLAADIPGYTPSSAENDPTTSTDLDCRAWWSRNDRTGAYDGLEDAFNTIAEAICAEDGGIDGVIGFSQGGAAAALVASLLEPGRQEAFTAAAAAAVAAVGKKTINGDNDLADGAMAYPSSFEALQQQGHQGQLKFAVMYSAFLAPNPLYAPFYEPKIATPTLHVVGTLDSVVEESRSLALVEACGEPKVVYHPGGHFVPIGKDMVGALAGFIRHCCEAEKLEESAEDMDLPF